MRESIIDINNIVMNFIEYIQPYIRFALTGLVVILILAIMFTIVYTTIIVIVNNKKV